VKPDIVFFGEQLPEEFHRNIKQDVNEADCVIVIGSSLKVAPVSEILQAVSDHVPQIIINRELLSHLKHHFDVHLLGNADSIVIELCRRLNWKLDHPAVPSTPEPLHFKHHETNVYVFEGGVVEEFSWSDEGSDISFGCDDGNEDEESGNSSDEANTCHDSELNNVSSYKGDFSSQYAEGSNVKTMNSSMTEGNFAKFNGIALSNCSTGFGNEGHLLDSDEDYPDETISESELSFLQQNLKCEPIINDSSQTEQSIKLEPAAKRPRRL
jgi:hypothetical protein